MVVERFAAEDTLVRQSEIQNRGTQFLRSTHSVSRFMHGAGTGSDPTGKAQTAIEVVTPSSWLKPLSTMQRTCANGLHLAEASMTQTELFSRNPWPGQMTAAMRFRCVNCQSVSPIVCSRLQTCRTVARAEVLFSWTTKLSTSAPRHRRK